jgi:molybdopterin-containing oxidoreductase family membrane subunit
LVGFWLFAISVACWFAWRGYELHRYGDVWTPAIILGGLISTIFFIFASTFTYLFIKIGSTAKGPPVKIPISEVEEELTRFVLRPLTPRFKLIVFVLFAILSWGMYCWWYQMHNGLGVTGLNRPVFWGFYIVNFVFFIGISHAGTLVSAILRISQAEWRRPITRAAEAITVMVLGFGAWNILLDMGRMDQAWRVFERGRLGSPLMWDVCSITTYLIASTLYLYLPLIPDLARLRNRVTGWRRPLYHLLSFGWTDTPGQKHALERCVGIMAVVVLPIAVSVHTVVSWVFSMTVQPMWHSTIFGPYFVVGAIFSGIAALLVAMALIRKHLKLQDFLKDVHFNYLGILLLVMSCLWMYFTASEYITVFYGAEPGEMGVFNAKFSGKYAPYFWAMVATCFVIPMAILVRRKTRTVTGTVIASLSICIGMWLERFTIVVPTLEDTRLQYPSASYTPTWVEVSLMGAAFAGFILLYLLFARLFPIVSIWEVEEGREEAAEKGAERVQSYFPKARSVVHKRPQ